MKIVFSFLFLIASVCCPAQKTVPEFAIYFGNEFADDTITIYANGIRIASAIPLQRTMQAPQSLVIIQDNASLSIAPYRQARQHLDKIPLRDSILKLDIILKDTGRSFRVDLRKGKYIFPEIHYIPAGWSGFRPPVIWQSRDEPIYF